MPISLLLSSLPFTPSTYPVAPISPWIKSPLANTPSCKIFTLFGRTHAALTFQTPFLELDAFREHHTAIRSQETILPVGFVFALKKSAKSIKDNLLIKEKE